MSLSEKIVKLDSRYVWLVMIVMYAIPIVIPLGIPITVYENTRTLYNRIDELGPDDIILCEYGISLRYLSGMEAGSIAMTKHMFSTGVSIVFYSIDPEGPAFYGRIMGTVKPEESFGVKYGEDYVYLGYIAGQETAQVAMMRDIWGTVSIDNFGNKLEDLPLMANVHSVDDVDWLMAIRLYGDQGEGSVRAYSITGGLMGDKAWGTYSSGGIVATLQPFVHSGHIIAAIGGITGGAEYENISGFLGEGLQGTDITSMTQMYMLFLIIVSNIAYFTSTLGGKGKER